MTLAEARSRCAPRSPWYEREAHTPCYGKTYPRLETDQEQRLWRLLNELSAAIGLRPREAGQGQWDAASREEGIDAVPVPEDPAQWPSLLAWLNAGINRSTTVENDPRLRAELAQSPIATRVYDLAALHRAKNQLIAMMAATKADSAEPHPEGESKHIVPVVDQNPPPPRPKIDFKALAAALRKEGKGNQAKLVEYMADKEEATAEEIAQHVHGDSEASDQAMWNNAKRTTDSLALLDSRLSFRFTSGRMYRDDSPKEP